MLIIALTSNIQSRSNQSCFCVGFDHCGALILQLYNRGVELWIFCGAAYYSSGVKFGQLGRLRLRLGWTGLHWIFNSVLLKFVKEWQKFLLQAKKLLILQALQAFDYIDSKTNFQCNIKTFRWLPVTYQTLKATFFLHKLSNHNN